MSDSSDTWNDWTDESSDSEDDWFDWMDKSSTSEGERFDGTNKPSDSEDEWFDAKPFMKFSLSAYEKRTKEYLTRDLSTINWEGLKSKLKNATFVPKLNPVPRWLRFIDVVQRKIVRAPREPFDYICLSYTWGKVKDFQAKVDNITRLQEYGALDRPENPEEPQGPDNPAIPATIKDAMTACKCLGQRYLWVDRLCIVQDGPEDDIQAHFDGIGRIYNHALVTLIAYEGRDARHGLHGISRPIFSKTPENDFWTRSEWLKRGWTYQEAVLSRNVIIFLRDGVIFEHDGEAFLSRELQEPRITQHTMMFHGAVHYCEAVENYTERMLSHRHDIVNAFSGICSHLFDRDHLFGMPRNDFDSAMHWWVKDGQGRRRPCTDGHIFPTWTWSSMEGHIIFPRDLQMLIIPLWAFVDYVDSHGNASLGYPRPNFNMFGQGGKNNALTRMAYHAYLNGYVSISPTESIPQNMTITQFQTKFPSYAQFWEHSRGVKSSSDRSPGAEPLYFREFSEEQKNHAKTPGRILVNTWISKLDVTHEGAIHGSIGIHIFNDGDYIGAGYAEGISERSLHRGHLTFFALSAGVLEAGELQEVFSPLEFFNTQLNDPGTRKEFFYVAVIAIEESKESGVFRRIGSALISFDTWFEKLDRERRSFVLE
ncbi:heterokaryon incompatibility protein-domain-containing protein [Phyllosticta citriasiana]|uniref:Heterokaryon incompatibility protein-domain-containing protein n=1 Tax=Phyllosticta citriasiana TaxID=595635 RepID=A0ABR1KWS2_9PEZI